MKISARYILIFAVCSICFTISSCKENVFTPIDEIPRFVDGYPVFSQDGKHMAYYSYDNHNPSVNGAYIMDISGIFGTNKRMIGKFYPGSFSPDGQWVMYSSGGNLYKKRFEGDTIPVRLTTDNSSYAYSWSRDGEWVAYESSQNSTMGSAPWKMRIDGTKKRRIIYAPTLGEIRSPTWFPDGIRLCVKRYDRAYSQDGDAVIGIVDTNGNSLATFPNSDRLSIDDPIVSPDGNYIAYTISRNNRTLCIIKTDGTGYKELTTGYSSQPGWTSDGSYVLYTNTNNQNGRIWAVTKDATDHTQITY